MTQYLLVAVISLSVAAGVRATAPVPEDKLDAQQAAIKEVVGKVVAAAAKQDIESLVKLSGFPWYRGPGEPIKDAKGLAKHFEKAFEGKQPGEAKVEIKSVETFKKAQATLSKDDVKNYETVLSSTDYIVHITVDQPGIKTQLRILLKHNDGKYNLVGIEDETRD